ncbi:MAG: hypothetical protein LBH08_03285 [Puniceicoccales bacterium]|jgi:hypothetical protein|nr:hypothetical protein [Puniceicoccales bacterium]
MSQIEGIQKKNDTPQGNVTVGPQGTYRGQPVTIIQDLAPSAIQLASNVAGFEATKQKSRNSILNRTIVTKKIFKEKENILATYTERLGQQKQSKRYKETYGELNRMQYKLEYEREENQDELRNMLLYKVSEVFGEVTEQDNVLEYAIAMNDIERINFETEIGQVKKMIALFSEPEKNFINIGFANTERMNWIDKLTSLEKNLHTHNLLKKQLLRAQELLRKTHKREIYDGYNLIPKAAAILNQQYGDDGNAPNAISLAVSYRDEVLNMKNSLDIFEVFILRQEKKREDFRTYLDSMIALFGIDMASTNPSRSKEELRSVRDGLFHIEICGQIYDSVGVLGHDIRRIFEDTKG